MKATVALFAVFVAVPCAFAAKPITETDSVEVKAKIVAIDHLARVVTLMDKDGVLDSIQASPEVKRFDELKVGDTVTFRYYQSIAYQIRKPGDPASPPDSDQPTIERRQGGKPGATITQQKTTAVTVQAIDSEVPSVRVVTEEGRSLSLHVDDRKYMKDLKVGDRVEVTYVEGLMVNVK